jgi:hypothetical protein
MYEDELLSSGDYSNSNNLKDVLDDELARLCYEVFYITDSGKTLMYKLQQYVSTLTYSSNPLITMPEYNSSTVIAKTARKDLVYGMHMLGVKYKEALDELSK